LEFIPPICPLPGFVGRYFGSQAFIFAKSFDIPIILIVRLMLYTVIIKPHSSFTFRKPFKLKLNYIKTQLFQLQFFYKRNHKSNCIILTNKYLQTYELKLFPIFALYKVNLLFFDNLAKKPKSTTLYLSNYINNQLMKTRSFFTVR